MPDKEKIVSIINESFKIALTAGSLSLPALGLAALLPDYIFKFLSSKGVLSGNIDKKFKQQLNSVIRITIENTHKELSTGSYRELVSQVSEKLSQRLKEIDAGSMTPNALEGAIEDALRDESLWEGNYFSNEDIRNITSTFYRIFMAEITKHEELWKCVEIARMESLANGLDLLVIDVRQLKGEVEVFERYIKELKNEIEKLKKEDKDNSGFVITEGADITPTQYFVGREEELKALREQVRSACKLVLVSGIGGIGKTHLCRKLYQEYVDNYKEGKETDIDHIGYLNYTGSMDDTLVNGLKYNKTGNYEEDIRAAWHKLGDMANNKNLLVIIDNVNKFMYKVNEHEGDESLRKLYNLTCAVLITSRLNGFERFETLKIDTLPLDKCRDIFCRIYGETDTSEQEDLDYILSDLAARHTKTVELLAHIAKNKRWKVARLRQELTAKHFNLLYISEGNKANLQSEYEKLFNLTGLSESEINVLEAFSILPPLPITADTCNEFFNGDAGLSEDDEIFNILYEKGWLDEDETSFSMHPVIAEVIFAKQRPVIATHSGLSEACKRYITCAATEVFTKALLFMPFAEAIAEKLHDDDSKIIGYLSHQIGVIYSSKGEYDKALEWYQKALIISETVLGKEYPSTATTYNNIALVYSRKGEYDKALEWYQKALTIKETVLAKEHPSAAATYNNIAGVYSSKGEYDKALEWNQKALIIKETVLGKEHPDTAITYNNIAGVYSSKGEYDKALEWNQKALIIRETVLGREHPDTATTYNNIAAVYYSKGEYDKALDWYQKALIICETVLGKEHPNTATTYNNIAVVYLSKREYDKALDWYQKALTIRETVLGKEHPSTATTYNNIAVVYSRKGEYEKALERHLLAFYVLLNKLGQNHPNTKTARNNMYTSYIESGGEQEDFQSWLDERLKTMQEDCKGV